MLSRSYNSIAAGIVERDDLLNQQIANLKREREAAQNALDRAPRGYLRAVIDHIVVGPHVISIVGSKETLARAVAGDPVRPNVRSFEPKWRALRESNPPLQRERLPS